MIMSYAGISSLRSSSPQEALTLVLSGGTAGCVLAGRLAEDSDLSILLVEAGPSNEAVPASAMPAGFVCLQPVINHDRRADFCTKLDPDRGLEGRLEYQGRSFSPVE